MNASASKPTVGRTILFICAGLALTLILIALLYAAAFGPRATNAPKEQFLVRPDESVDQIGKELTQQGYVRGAWIFELAYLRATPNGRSIRPGEYTISKSMDAWSIGSALVELPSVAWVTVPVGVRKEQIADILADALGWSDDEKQQWLSVTASSSPNYVEGVYFPDTYLIPTDETPALIAERMQDRFKEAFTPYAALALKKHMPWPTVVTIASLIQREAGGVEDMPIISGIIEKRLSVGMPLAIDATLQYIAGSEAHGWWTAPGPAASYPDTAFNTYTRKGLPPHAIAEPGLAAIEAALNPTSTSCLFYLHDAKGQIHCSPTYSGHLANIRKYLR